MRGGDSHKSRNKVNPGLEVHTGHICTWVPIECISVRNICVSFVECQLKFSQILTKTIKIRQNPMDVSMKSC